MGDGEPSFQVYSLVLAGFENPMPEIPVLLMAPAWKRPWIWDQVWLPYHLFRKRVRVFHSCVALGPLPQISFPVFCRYRGIAEIQDWQMFRAEATEIEKFYRRTMRIRIQKSGISKIRRIVVHSEFVRAESIRQGIDAKRIRLIRLGCDHFDALMPEAWPMENFVLSVGDTPNKNLPFTNAVLSLLRTRFIHLNWVIVGSRELVLKQLGCPGETLPEWITLLEKPSDGVLKACYQKALALLFPSTQEGFGIPAMEAMRLGCPVLAFDIEPMKSLINHAPSLMPVSDPEAWCAALIRLLQNQEFREAARAAGRNQAADFTWDNTAKALLQLFQT